MSARLTLLIASLCLAGCAAAIPGYSPPPFKEKHKFGVGESGALQGDGTYRLSETENKLDCKHLTGSMYVIITQLKAARDRVEPTATATSSQQALGSLFSGSTRAADPKAEDARAHAKLRAYNAQLASKNCKTLDIDAELAKPPEAPRKY
jgi:hypothetical protein